MMINYKTADKMMDFAAYIYANLTKGQATDEEIKKFATGAFTSFCEHEGIDEVEIDENDEDFEDNVDEIGYNPFMGEYDWDC